MAKKVERRLAQLGARRLVATGLGDDQHPLGYEGARGEWVRRLLQALKAHRSGQWAHVDLAGPGAGGMGPPKYAVTLQEAAPGGPCCVRELCEGAWVLDAAEVRAVEIQSSMWDQQQDSGLTDPTGGTERRAAGDEAAERRDRLARPTAVRRGGPGQRKDHRGGSLPGRQARRARPRRARGRGHGVRGG